jgi:hypothetical protein
LFEKRVEGIFGPKREEETGGWEKICLKKSFIIFTGQILLGLSNHVE